MQKLFRFSKIASLVVFLMAIIKTVSFFYLRDLDYYNDFLSCYNDHEDTLKIIWNVESILFYLFYGIVLIYFLLIYRNSAKESVLRIPSLIGFISAIACLILPIIMRIIRSYMLDNYDYSKLELLSQIWNYTDIVFLCGLSVAIIWTAKYLKILPKIFAYLCALSVILLAFLLILGNLMPQLFSEAGGIINYHYLGYVIGLLSYFLFAVFYFLFSKMANK